MFRKSLLVSIFVLVFSGTGGVSYAGHKENHNPGGGGGEEDGGEYSLVISGDVSGSGGLPIASNGGVAVPWVKVSSTRIGFSNPDFNAGEFENLEAFMGPFGLDGMKCFAGENIEIWAGNLKKGRGSRAEGMFWFDGKTRDGLTVVSYVLKVFGVFDDPDTSWPPTSPGVPVLLIMESWDIAVNNGQPGLKGISCQIDGQEFIGTMDIRVVLEN